MAIDLTLPSPCLKTIGYQRHGIAGLKDYMTLCADGKYEVWLVLDTYTLMELPEELLAFHAASRDSILPKSGAFKNIDLTISYFVAQAVIRELDNRKMGGHSDGELQQHACKALAFLQKLIHRHSSCLWWYGTTPVSMISSRKVSVPLQRAQASAACASILP